MMAPDQVGLRVHIDKLSGEAGSIHLIARSSSDPARQRRCLRCAGLLGCWIRRDLHERKRKMIRFVAMQAVQDPELTASP